MAEIDATSAQKIVLEISKIDLLFEKAEPLFRLCALKEPDFIELSALSSVLHSYYNGLENIFLVISKNMDKNVPSGQRWHRELLDSMFSANGFRGAVLDESVHEQLLDFMSFRHVFRHSYGFEMDWRRLEPLCAELQANWKAVRGNLLRFASADERGRPAP